MAEDTKYIFVQPKFEPYPKGFRKVGPLMLCFWVRPLDFCWGLQVIHGGVLVGFWPVTVGVVHIARAASGFRHVAKGPNP